MKEVALIFLKSLLWFVLSAIWIPLVLVLGLPLYIVLSIRGKGFNDYEGPILDSSPDPW